MKWFGQIDETDIRSNQIRKELGSDWGQRLSYKAASINGINYTPMTQAAKIALQNAMLQANTLNGLTNPASIKIPTTGVAIF